MRIALDAMGGDFAPLETVKGAVQALDELEGLTVVLVGKKEEIEEELIKYTYDKNRIEIYDAREVIEIFKGSDIEVELEGTGVVQSQSLEPQKELVDTKKIKIKLN